MKNIRELIAQMTLEEKASLCSGKDFWYLKGIERLGIPSIMVTDGPHGLRKTASQSSQIGITDTVPATCFPTASALAATWNRDLIYQVGQALGDECRQEKVGVILGPGANIKRSPLCGRNFEYFSEDPYLTGEMAASHINGVQSRGVGTSLKHFAVNNQETRRMAIDAIVDERTLREIYLAGFEKAVKAAQPWTVMCAYNMLNGTYCSEHETLLTRILKKEWGHSGLVVTDWGAINDRVEGLKAGLELEMPGLPNGNDASIVAAVQSGQLDEAVLDKAVERLLTLILKADESLSIDSNYDRDAHHALARRVAAEGAVLLKNEAALLPLPVNARIALIGRFAKHPRYQGAGSSLMNPTRLDTLYDELGALVGKENLIYADGYTDKGDVVDQVLIEAALNVSRKADIAVVCAGLTDMDEVEGLDRTHMKLPAGHDALIHALAAAHHKLVVVLSNGSPVEMPWVGNVSTIIEAYLGGQAGAGGVADILTGRVNPSGKLAETFPLKLEDNPSYYYFPAGPATVEYRESLYVGYRYYDSVLQEVLFPFGHGLSYTCFEYGNLKLSRRSITDAKTLKVSLKVKNTGKLAGKEIVQFYVRDVEATPFRPHKELKGFAKVELKPGKKGSVSIELDKRAFAYYNTDLKDWTVESGDFEILVGASSRDIRLKARLKVSSTLKNVYLSGRDRSPAYHYLPKGASVTQHAFESLLGRPVPANLGSQKGSYTINTPIGDMSDSFIGRLLHDYMGRQIKKIIAGQEETPTALLMEVMIDEAPLRTLLMAGDGTLTRPMLDAMLVMINGHFFKGAVALVKARRRR
jgi:beta-glucosidase